MEWTDIVVKIGVGACLGFGIIVLAKLGRKKNTQDQKISNPGPDGEQDPDNHVDTERNKP